MSKALRIVVVEDDPFDVVRIKSELETAGFCFELTRVETELELRRELDQTPPDLILSDHGLPTFDGFTALRIVREKSPQLPFIFVSGSNDQSMVIDMYDQGATDYVFKNDIADLDVAVRHALELPPATETAQAGAPRRRQIQTLLPSRPPRRLAHLRFCPVCLRTWDVSGHSCQPGDYFNTYDEVVVVRESCAGCEPRGPV